MKFDLNFVPFSRRESFLAVSLLPESKNRQQGLYLRTVRGGDDKFGEAFRIELLDQQNQTIPFTTEASPEIVRLNSPVTPIFAEICISDSHTVRFRSIGCGVRLTFIPAAYDYAYEVNKNSWEVNSFTHECRFMLTGLVGGMKMEVPWDKIKSSRVIAEFTVDMDTNTAEFAVEEFRTVWEPRPKWESFDDDVEAIRTEFNQWLDSSLAIPDRWQDARELAAYITWSCLVPAEGCLTRPAMYMSKNWMTNIWSWDHCFNAMALVRHDPKLAWDQFMIFFDRQDESGLIPDFVNDKYELWNCNKPPIHGWTLAWMMKRTDYIREAQLREVYGPLSKWTKWWFRYRDDDGDGIPQYNHGNDSGWDNSTAFNNGIPVESPDLAAFLIIQTELLAEIAGLLGLTEESSEWRKLADNTLEKMISHFWKDGRFISLRSGTHEPSAGDSLLLFVPILLGKRLPEPIRDVLLKGLGEENRFLTENGWATESISSPYYIPDGYWRGPIWAPSTMLLVEGVAAAGDLELAQEVSRRFCNMLSRSGMAENFDALTGEGLRDRAFTWTSSVFLILGHEYTT
ncbi:trehalase family glycosidase [Paenibacillus sp. UMB7766-LJ446]|uniref:amylo-alpha-1,6-glucosidase n=1 Tax=Paenibacillus sp. UMB7766-LJ446 TaxID=3046313 RepID=UPI00254BB6AC|nr:trehalase family glycosidase [Paenibacillus sp. UMB7766-LJ446]MDK8190276.1 trehalase family glycosidase [Paenibacillus sp. UMB7766-LJ446]